jgi:ACS family allantoate permease-like MFS transporter
MGSGASQVVGTGLALLIAKHVNRTAAGLWPLFLAIIGVIMMLAIPEANYGARYGGYILMYQCECSSNHHHHHRWRGDCEANFLPVPICVLTVITFMTAGVAGTTKKFAITAAYQLGYAVGNIIGPQTYSANSAPNYYVSLENP